MSSYNVDLKEWSGPASEPLFNPKAPAGEILYYALSMNQDQVVEVSVEDESHLTYAELKLRACRVALNLTELEIGLGDTVCMMCFSNKNASAITLGCVFIGAPFSCLHLEYGKDDLVLRLSMLKPKLFICDESRKEIVQSAIKEVGLSIKLITFDCVEDLLQRPVAGDDDFVPTLKLTDTEKTVFCYFYTSGTTGTPKIVCISHAYFIAQCLCNLTLFASCGVTLYYCPISWIANTISLFSNIITGGRRILLSEMVTYDRLAWLMQKYKARAFFTLPIYTAQFVTYMEANGIFLDAMKIWINGGYPISDGLKDRILQRIPNGKVLIGYGMTEILVCTANTKQKPGAVGEVAARLRLKIVNDENERLGPNETGEICAKCVIPIMGYLSDEANKEAFDSDGFIRTGDLGYFDAEGSLYVEGRKKDLIKHKGVAMNANMVEGFIIKETGLTQCCIVGLDDYVNSDELPAAAIIKPENCKYTEEDIVKLAAEKLPAHKHLDDGVYFVDELPCNSSGKIQRHEVKKLLVKMLDQRTR